MKSKDVFYPLVDKTDRLHLSELTDFIMMFPDTMPAIESCDHRVLISVFSPDAKSSLYRLALYMGFFSSLLYYTLDKT